MKTFDLEQYGLVHPIQLKVSVYHYGKNIAIQMITHENGYAEPWSNLTVNPDYILRDHPKFCVNLRCGVE